MQYDEVIQRIISSREEEWYYDEDFLIYVFKNDVRISIHEDDNFERILSKESWINKLPLKIGYINRFIIKYNNSFVESFLLIGVDDYQAYLPHPDQNHTVDRKAYQLAKIVSIAFPEGDFEEMFRRAGFSLS